jgi:hypothetical protein
VITVRLHFYFTLDVKARIQRFEADARKLKSEEFRARYKAKQEMVKRYEAVLLR